jgi:hypothetical protein
MSRYEEAGYSPLAGLADESYPIEPIRSQRPLASNSHQHLSAAEAAILRAVAYADVFDYPLTADEAHRYLAGVSATSTMVNYLLGNGRLVPQRLIRYQGYLTLPGREEIVETRRRREQVAARMWPRAVRYARIIAGLPFVRMVAVTGALAMDNVDQNADIDYLIVTQPGRLWLCRALVIVLVRLVAWRGQVLCPNYFLSENALILQERNPFTAHELAHMVPIAGMATYHHMRQLNTWTARFLPNAGGPPRRAWQTAGSGFFDQVAAPPGNGNRAIELEALEIEGSWRSLRSMAEAVLEAPPGEWLERWEMARKVRKFSQQRERLYGSDRQAEASFCADWCKGHFENYGQRTLAAFAERLRALELDE